MAKKANKSSAKKKLSARGAVKRSTKTPVRRSPVPKAPAKAKKTAVRNSPVPSAKPRGKAAAAIAAPATASVAVVQPVAITHEMIAMRAYFIAQSGFGASEFENWLRAEWELNNGTL